jgi:hypothetical protein
MGERRLDHRLQQAGGDHREHRETAVEIHHEHEGRRRGQHRRGDGQQDRFAQRGRQVQRRQQPGEQKRRADHDPRQGGRRAPGGRQHADDPLPVDARHVARHQPDDRRRHQRPQHRREIGKQNTHEQRCREHRGGVAAKRLEGA